MRTLAPSALLLALALAPAPGRAGPLVAQAAAAPAVPTASVTAKLGEGDRLALAGDHRNALFAYLDALYAQPALVAARVKVGRAYLALRYPARAVEQAEIVLAAEPGHAEAKALLDEAKFAALRQAGAPAAEAPAAAPAPAPRPAPRIVKVAPEPERTVSVSDGSGVEHYRTALGLLQTREYGKAVAELTLAVKADPRLAVAYSARGSAQFGLGKYREAADDYAAAIDLDPKLGTPIYGLAEAYRQLGDNKRAAEAYQRYADSNAPDVREDLRAAAARRAAELQ